MKIIGFTVKINLFKYKRFRVEGVATKILGRATLNYYNLVKTIKKTLEVRLLKLSLNYNLLQ